MSYPNKKSDEMLEHGRAIARAMREHEVQMQKNMAKAAKRKQTMLEKAADELLG